jgi:hypothetical protein
MWNFDLIKDLINAALLIICTIFLTFCYYGLSKKDETIHTLQSQLAMLEQESKAKEEQYNKRAKLAKEQFDVLQNKTNNIMKQKVSHDCNQAMQWAIKQAENF